MEQVTVNTMSPPDPLLTQNFLWLTGAHFIQALGYSSMTMLPVFLESLGATRENIGEVMASAAIGGLLARPLVGLALDLWGKRRTLVVGTCIAVIGLGLLGFVGEMSWLPYVARLCFGIGAGTLFTGYFALAADYIPDSRRTEGLAIFGASGLLPLAVNPLIGMTLFEVSDLRYYFPLVGLLLATSLFCLAMLKPTHGSPALVARPKVKALIREIDFLKIAPVLFAAGILAGLISLFLAFSTVTARPYGKEAATGIWIIYALTAAGIRLVGAKLPDRLGVHNIVVPALGAYLGAYLLVANAESASSFWVAGFLGGIGHGYGFPALVSQLFSRVPVNARGLGMALYTGLWESAALLVNPIFGEMLDVYPTGLVFSGAVLVGVGLLLFWVVFEHWYSKDCVA